MSWFGGYRPQNQSNRVHTGQNQDPQNLLVPDPDSSIDEGNNIPAAAPVVPAAQAQVMAPPVNYDAHHADDEADNAMDKAINALKNKQWGEDDLRFYFAQIEVQMKKAGVKSNFTKLQVLSTIIPKKVEDEIKNILKIHSLFKLIVPISTWRSNTS